MDHSEFDSVSWGSAGNGESPHPSTTADPLSGDDYLTQGKQRVPELPTSPQAGRDADPMDLAGIGGGRLDCTVDAPQKENEGTKDAFISYRVTTHVRPLILPVSFPLDY